jgi:hypothetical protein
LGGIGNTSTVFTKISPSAAITVHIHFATYTGFNPIFAEPAFTSFARSACTSTIFDATISTTIIATNA